MGDIIYTKGRNWNYVEVNSDYVMQPQENLIFIKGGDVITLLKSFEHKNNIIIKNLSELRVKLQCQEDDKINNKDFYFLPVDTVVELEYSNSGWKIKIIENFEFIEYDSRLIKDYVPEKFPYYKLVINPDNELVFKFYVDALYGDDSKDGLTWNKAKKTIGGALDELPSDCLNYRVWIVVHSGTYNEMIDVRRFRNVIIRFFSTSILLNTALGDWAGFIRNGAISPIRDDNQVIVENSSGTELIGAWGQLNTTIEFYAHNVDKSWDEDEFNIAHKFKFVGDVVDTSPLMSILGCNFKSGVAVFELDLKNAMNGIESAWNDIFQMGGAKIIGGTGEASTVAQRYRAVFMLNTCQKTIFDLSPQNTFAGVVHRYYGKTLEQSICWDITGIRNFAAMWENGIWATRMEQIAYMTYAQGSLPDGNLPYIWLSPTCVGYVKYHSDIFRVYDESTLVHQFRDAKTAVTTTVLTKDLYDDGTHLYYKNIQID